MTNWRENMEKTRLHAGKMFQQKHLNGPLSPLRVAKLEMPQKKRE